MQRMGQLEGKWIAGALIPGLIIAILFYFGEQHSVCAAASCSSTALSLGLRADHNVSSQMAQRPEASTCACAASAACRLPVCSALSRTLQFNLKRPAAYHYDLALLGVVTIVCGLLGVPPPQVGMLAAAAAAAAAHLTLAQAAPSAPAS